LKEEHLLKSAKNKTTEVKEVIKKVAGATDKAIKDELEKQKQDESDDEG